MTMRSGMSVTWGDVYGYASRNSATGCNYLSPLLKTATAEGWMPNSVPDNFIEVIIAHRPKPMNQPGFANTMVARFNEAAESLGLPRLVGLETSRNVRAKLNASLHPNVLSEIEFRCESLVGTPATKGNARRRLLKVARDFADWPLSSFVEVAEPLHLDAFVRYFEPDPGARFTINTGRKRALAEVANLLEEINFEDEANAIREMIAILPKAGLQAAQKTEDRVLLLDEPDVDDMLIDRCEADLAMFADAPGRETLWRAQAALASLIILKEASDLKTIWQTSFEWHEGNLAGSHYPILTIPPKVGQTGWIDVTTGDDSGALFHHILGFCRTVFLYKKRRPRHLFETIGASTKNPPRCRTIYIGYGARTTSMSPQPLCAITCFNKAMSMVPIGEDIRNMNGGATIDNVRFRFQRLVRQRATGDVADAIEQAYVRS